MLQLGIRIFEVQEMGKQIQQNTGKWQIWGLQKRNLAKPHLKKMLIRRPGFDLFWTHWLVMMIKIKLIMMIKIRRWWRWWFSDRALTFLGQHARACRARKMCKLVISANGRTTRIMSHLNYESKTPPAPPPHPHPELCAHVILMWRLS